LNVFKSSTDKKHDHDRVARVMARTIAYSRRQTANTCLWAERRRAS